MHKPAASFFATGLSCGNLLKWSISSKNSIPGMRSSVVLFFRWCSKRNGGRFFGLISEPGRVSGLLKDLQLLGEQAFRILPCV